MLSAYHEICKLQSFNEVIDCDKLLKRERKVLQFNIQKCITHNDLIE